MLFSDDDDDDDDDDDGDSDDDSADDGGDDDDDNGDDDDTLFKHVQFVKEQKARRWKMFTVRRDSAHSCFSFSRQRRVFSADTLCKQNKIHVVY